MSLQLHSFQANIQGGDFRAFSGDLNHSQHISVGSSELVIAIWVIAI